MTPSRVTPVAAGVLVLAAVAWCDDALSMGREDFRVECETTEAKARHKECRLLKVTKASKAQVVDAFRTMFPGRLRKAGSLSDDLEVLQLVPVGVYGWLKFHFWIYDNTQGKVIVSGVADAPVEIMDVDGEIGNEVLTMSNVTDTIPMGFVHQFVPELVAYSVSESGAVQVMDPLIYPKFREFWGKELDLLREYFEDGEDLLVEFLNGGRITGRFAEELKGYISFQLQVIDYQSFLLNRDSTSIGAIAE